MSNQKIALAATTLALFFIVMSGCYKTTTVLVDNTPVVTKTVSFSTDIIPVLTANCTNSGCHGGSVAPNLTAGNAFSALVNGNYTNSTDAANSEVYLWLTGKRSATMPLGASNNPSNINGLILAWITQGVKNN